MKIFPVILSGGSGTRLWPLSRKEYPKQYLPLFGENTMLQDTVLRLTGLEFLASPIIICNSEHRFLVAEQMKKINFPNPTIILEPVGRNTAPAITAAVLQVQEVSKSEDDLLLVLPADHVFRDVSAFHSAVSVAIQSAIIGKLVTFGVVPNSPHTGYGYIKAKLPGKTSLAMPVESFKEKPALETAKEYLKENALSSSRNLPLNWYWNGGMFMFNATSFLTELSKHQEDVLIATKKSFKKSKRDLDFLRLDEKEFVLNPNLSIDYAVMEKSSEVVVISLDAGWSDVGSWPTLLNESTRDEDNNFLQGDVVAKNTKHCFVRSPHKLTTTLGVEDLIVVDSPDALLIAKNDEANNIGSILETLSGRGRKEVVANQKVYRPWGWFDSLELGDNYQVKRLHVNPGGKLSLQMHHKRSEHWVVINGTATATVGARTSELGEGESIYIPLREKHALENRTSESLDIVEVQTGNYLGEDDIVRFSDVYGRVVEEKNLGIE